MPKTTAKYYWKQKKEGSFQSLSKVYASAINCNTFMSFPHSWLIAGLASTVSWRVPLVQQELLALPENLRSYRVLCEVLCLSIFTFLCSIRSTIVCLTVRYLFVIVLSVHLRFSSSAHPVGIFKLFVQDNQYCIFLETFTVYLIFVFVFFLQGLWLWCVTPFQQHFSYIVAVRQA